MIRKPYDILIIGAGITGCVLANVLRRHGRILVVDERPHIGGNCYDKYDEHGLLYHEYGPHIFHTNNEKAWNFVTSFTNMMPYEHRVLGSVDGQLIPIPVNINTFKALNAGGLDLVKGKTYTLGDIPIHLQVLLLDKVFKNYSEKQWGIPFDQIDKETINRIPIRCNYDDRYFTDKYQGIPDKGYTDMLTNMIVGDGINIMLSTPASEVLTLDKGNTYLFGQEHNSLIVINTGCIDHMGFITEDWAYHNLENLNYRAVEFVHTCLDVERFQPVATVNYPNNYDFTRITEYKHMTKQVHPKTIITYEYPADYVQYQGMLPCYPINNPVNTERYNKYRKFFADTYPNVHFAGRLGNYKYINMDQAVDQALTLANKLKERTELC